ncbi:MAG: carboxypeptidase-like regulatory domain-containing protein [Ignavibacteriaceae bacterium]|nr:carboxypeptidase-like regulatory domain-containing protein [Ignavibacteriaceae bacterium]
MIRIAGNVFDAADSSSMLIGAPVRLQKNNIDSIFTSTDYEGNFTVQFRLPEYDTLTASSIGYKRKKIDIRKKLLGFSKHWIK